MTNQITPSIINDIALTWTECDEQRLNKYYSSNFEGDYYGEKVKFNDLLSRLHYMKAHQQNRKLDILETVAEANKLAVRFNYQAVDDKEGKLNNEVFALYHFNDDNKITHVWAFSNQKVHYYRYKSIIEMSEQNNI